MASINRLSAVQIKSLKKKGLHADGGGLYLRISDSGTKGWVFRYSLRKKAHRMGLGSLQTVSLAEARMEAEQCRKLLREGIDPINHRRAARGQQDADTAKAMTFKDCAEAYIKSHSAGWKNAKHISQWHNTLSTYVYPVFGTFPVSEIDVGLVLKALEPIWKTKTETASRVRGRIENVLDWATARDYRTGSNPARWKGRLDKLLPPRAKVQKVIHHPALPYENMSSFMKDLRTRDAISARGLEFLILTAARTGEVLGTKWSEIDFDKAVWTIPEGRMKMEVEHRVPLAPDALDVLKGMKEIASSDYVFPGRDNKRPLSSMAFLQLMKRMGRSDLTVHGFRSTFRDWAAERTHYPREVAEMALAHAIENKVEAAYRRGDLFDKRRWLMNDWAQFCSKLPTETDGQVVASKEMTDDIAPLQKRRVRLDHLADDLRQVRELVDERGEDVSQSLIVRLEEAETKTHDADAEMTEYNVHAATSAAATTVHETGLIGIKVSSGGNRGRSIDGRRSSEEIDKVVERWAKMNPDPKTRRQADLVHYLEETLGQSFEAAKKNVQRRWKNLK